MSNGRQQQFKGWQSVNGAGVSADADSAQKWQEQVTPIITQIAPKDILNLDEVAQFYVKPKRTLVLKREKCQCGNGYKDRVTVWEWV
jgi:hypothetical protein